MQLQTIRHALKKFLRFLFMGGFLFSFSFDAAAMNKKKTKVEETPIQIAESKKIERKKGPWTKKEDEALRAFVESQDKTKRLRFKDCNVLGRNQKQCRDRWLNHLDPAVCTEKVTEEELAEIYKWIGKVGKKWAFIAEKLPGRTDNQIKNFYFGEEKKRKRKTVQNELGGSNPENNAKARAKILMEELSTTTKEHLFELLLLERRSKDPTKCCDCGNYLGPMPLTDENEEIKPKRVKMEPSATILYLGNNILDNPIIDDDATVDEID